MTEKVEPGMSREDYPLVANRDLMATAPELYRVLANAVAQYDAIKGGPILGALEAARPILAKARGDSQDETPGQAAKSGSHGIHPAPAEFTAEQVATDPILHFFHYAHLPAKLQATSRNFFLLAAHVVNTLPRNAERTVALRKLLEAKDAAVRANLPAPKKETAVASEAGSENTDDEDLAVIETGGHDIDRDGPVPFDG